VRGQDAYFDRRRLSVRGPPPRKALRIPPNLPPLNLTYQTVKSDISSLRAFGDAVIETGTWTATAKDKDKPFRSRLRCTAVWVKKNGA
jgi:hypothetical protein